MSIFLSYNELFINPVKSAISIAESKQSTSIFLFDQSSGHCAYVNNALVAHKIYVSDGGKQSIFKETLYGIENLKS